MNRKVLIVEDEEVIIELISEIFREMGNYTILSARDGEEALKTIRGNNPDIILLDIQIPKINGFDVCRTVKSDPVLSHIKIVMLSGMVQNSDLLKAGAAGADAFIAKPFKPTALIVKVEELLK